MRSLLEFRSVEFAIEVLELTDQLIETLRHVLSLLVRLEQLPFEGTDALALSIHFTAHLRVERALHATLVSERRDRALKPFEVVHVPVVGRNRETPLDRIVPTIAEGRQARSAR